MSAAGNFRRRVSIATCRHDDGTIEARCAIEDDYHHFRVLLKACDGQITGVQTDARRSPNSLCGAAGNRLTELVGMALNPASAAVLQHTDQFQQCTHQLDLAGLGVAAMAIERPRRTYDVTIPDRQDGHTVATVHADGKLSLRWNVTGMTVDEPAPYQGRSLGAGFTQFTSTLDREEAEAALVLRRALFVSQGRGMDLAELGDRGPVGGCWAWQPERLGELHRLPENRRDFSDRASSLLSEDADWLEFRA